MATATRSQLNANSGVESKDNLNPSETNTEISRDVNELVKEKDIEIDRLRREIEELRESKVRSVEKPNKDESISDVSSNVCVRSGCENIIESINVPRGDPIKLIPNFTWDTKDFNETKRFVLSFRKLSNENQWTEAHARAALESKLVGVGRSKYFEGLGDVSGISFNERLDEFEKLFSRELTTARSQELFWRCIQGRSESVTSFKLRLVSLGNSYRKEFINDYVFIQLLAQQFIKGLLHKYRMEVSKSDIKDFDEAVKLALKLEKCEQMYSSEEYAVSGVQACDAVLQDRVIKLTKENERLKSRQSGQYRNHRYYQVKCWGCGRPGHIKRVCRARNRMNDYKGGCDLCKHPSHDSLYCYMRVQQELNERRSKVNTAESEHSKEDNPGNKCLVSSSTQETPCARDVKNGIRNKKDNRGKSKSSSKYVKDQSEEYKAEDVATQSGETQEPNKRGRIYFVDYYKDKPCIDIVINGRSTRGLIDTGAQLSLLNSEFIKESDRKPTKSFRKLVSPLSDHPAHTQSTTIDLKMGDLEWSPQVCVSKLNIAFPYEFLIGYDILVKCNGVINVGEGFIDMKFDGKGEGEGMYEPDDEEYEWCQSFVELPSPPQRKAKGGKLTNYRN